jgi:hypothetical protein
MSGRAKGPGRWILCLAVIVGAMASEAGMGEAESAEELYQLALEDRRVFAERVTTGAASDLERASRLTRWLATHFDWTATDYKKRTVEQILERRGGNCAELARVATAMFEDLGMRLRTVREINLHVESAERRESARLKIAELGNRASVFGRRHNDHVWIEIQDRATGEWFPADPSLGVVGDQEWLAARLAFGARETLDPASKDMVAPFVVYARDESGELIEDRTEHYVIEGFDALYGGRLSELPAWEEWRRVVGELDGKALAAFRGEANLHDSEALIDELAQVYERLRGQYAARGD